MNSRNGEDILLKLRETGALLEGHFLLSSGNHSGYYLQCARFLQYPWNAQEAGKKIAEALKPLEPDCVVSPALGGVIIGHETARFLGVPFLFTERESGRISLRRFSLEGPARVVIVEDVVTTGRSTREAADAVSDIPGVEWVGVGCIVDRSAGGHGLPEFFRSLVKVDFPVYAPDQCPLCRTDIPLVKPGSRRTVS
ncbi:MAG: orotate phosphoribosyltransferase [Synergistota bacterium]|nr:orotate phosphoribosyltransferase [Synergistota bacterium]